MEADAGAADIASGDRDKHMRDIDQGSAGRAGDGNIDEGRGVPCLDWREYKPNTDAERRRESKLAGTPPPSCFLLPSVLQENKPASKICNEQNA